jgi:hypothetical protein
MYPRQFWEGQRSRHGKILASNAAKGEKAAQPGGRACFNLSGYVARSSSRYCGTDMLVACALPSTPNRSPAMRLGILTGSFILGLAVSPLSLGNRSIL